MYFITYSFYSCCSCSLIYAIKHLLTYLLRQLAVLFDPHQVVNRSSLSNLSPSVDLDAIVLPIQSQKGCEVIIREKSSFVCL